MIRAESAVDGVIGYAVRQHVTQIVVGEPLRPRWQEILRGSFVNRLIRHASEIDIHVIARRERDATAGRGRAPRVGATLVA